MVLFYTENNFSLLGSVMELKGEGEGGREGVHGGVGEEDYTSCI